MKSLMIINYIVLYIAPYSLAFPCLTINLGIPGGDRWHRTEVEVLWLQMWLVIASRTVLHDWPRQEPLTTRTGETDSCHTSISQNVESVCVW